ncbi:MAG: hypothetical protein IPO48_01490 [Saprospiraceae bacterium]|nr:hypothetical protein [Saprospiraceae bacterium]
MSKVAGCQMLLDVSFCCTLEPMNWYKSMVTGLSNALPQAVFYDDIDDPILLLFVLLGPWLAKAKGMLNYFSFLNNFSC